MDACPHCRAKLPDIVDAFCPECREDLNEPPRVGNEAAEVATATAPENAPDVSYLGVVLLFAGAACVITAPFMLFGDEQSKNKQFKDHEKPNPQWFDDVRLPRVLAPPDLADGLGTTKLGARAGG